MAKQLKAKTHRGAKKRLLITKGGIRHKQAGRSHLLVGKTASRKRQLRKSAPISAADRKRVQRLLPYA